MSEKLRVGILGGTGMVGQRFITLLENHPWFDVVLVAASGRSAGKLYEDAVEGRWKMQTAMPEFVKKMPVYDMDKDFDEIVSKVDFVFCAVNMPKAEIKALEERYAKAEVPVVSNNSANRWTPDVPMILPEVNPEHTKVIEAQKKRLGTTRGFIAVKPNCSIQSYAPALAALKEFEPKLVVATTYQAISGAGKTFEQWPEMVENIIPYIGGEEEKSEKEPLRILGTVENGEIVPAAEPVITCQCLRVPVLDGHTAPGFLFSLAAVRAALRPRSPGRLKTGCRNGRWAASSGLRASIPSFGPIRRSGSIARCAGIRSDGWRATRSIRPRPSGTGRSACSSAPRTIRPPVSASARRGSGSPGARTA